MLWGHVREEGGHDTGELPVEEFDFQQPSQPGSVTIGRPAQFDDQQMVELGTGYGAEAFTRFFDRVLPDTSDDDRDVVGRDDGWRVRSCTVVVTCRRGGHAVATRDRPPRFGRRAAWGGFSRR
jgi:hypothetical protein